MDLQTLKRQVRAGQIDTVMVAPARTLSGGWWENGSGGSLPGFSGQRRHPWVQLPFDVNLEMDPLDGFAVANWEAGFGDFKLQPDLQTIRELPWQPGTALVFCDHVQHGGRVGG